MDATYEIRGVILLYRDYRLRILREELDEAKTHVTDKSKTYNQARKLARHARERIKSRKRVASLLENVTSSSEAAEFQKLLENYPSEDILRQEAEIATRDAEIAHTAYYRSATLYQKASAEEKSRRAQVLWINKAYDTLLSKVFEQFGDVELICEHKVADKRLDVFFGGKDSPLGDGHAHWIFQDFTLVYRRDPGEK